MSSSNSIIDRLNWGEIASQLDVEGYATLPGLIGAEAGHTLAREIDTVDNARRVRLASADLGRGQLFFSDMNLPQPFETWRAVFYRRLAAAANRWREIPGVRREYPSLAATRERIRPARNPT